MNNRKIKTIATTLLLILLAMTISACSISSVDTQDTFSEIEERGYVVIGLDDTFAPMGFRDNNGEIVGFDVSLAREVFKRIGVEARFQPIDWSMKETELNSGNIDLIWNGYTITDERKEKVVFTKPYLENRQVIITLADSEIFTKEDLKEKTLAVQNSSSSLDAVNKEPEIVSSLKGGEPIGFDTNNDAFMDLEAGRVDVVVADEILARYYISQRGEEKYRVLEENFGTEEYGIGIRKQDVKLLEAVDKALDDMKKDGTSANISEEWFAENIVK